MKIAILSGKGGTGKTTVSNNLAAISGEAVLADCDVEEPNSHIFMNPDRKKEEEVSVIYPVIDETLCSHCKKCADFCHYNAILASGKITLPMTNLCHGCRGCSIVCPRDAIAFEHRTIGNIYQGVSRFSTKMIYGVLRTGEFSGVKIINRLQEMVEYDPLVIIDSPPGTSCSTVAAIENSDYAILVTEPTPFGVSDMKLVVKMLKTMDIPFSVFVNKSGLGNNEIYEYCRKEEIDIIGELPYEREIAEAYSKGKLAIEVNGELKSEFLSLRLKILKELGALCVH